MKAALMFTSFMKSDFPPAFVRLPGPLTVVPTIDVKLVVAVLWSLLNVAVTLLRTTAPGPPNPVPFKVRLRLLVNLSVRLAATVIDPLLVKLTPPSTVTSPPFTAIVPSLAFTRTEFVPPMDSVPWFTVSVP